MLDILIKCGLLISGLIFIWIIDRVWWLYDEYSEWARLKRRAEYRRKAYADMNQRWAENQNREALWKAVKK